MENEEYIYNCSKCNAIVQKEAKICPNCGENLEGIEENMEDYDEIKVPFHFRTLLTFGYIISIVGWLLIIGGVLLLIKSISSSSSFESSALVPGYSSFIMSVVFIFLGFLTVANGELLSCFVTIEKNSRETNNILWIKLNSILKKIK